MIGKPAYQAGIIQGIALSRTPGRWPEEVHGLGPIQGGRPFALCADCPKETHLSNSGSFCRYGERPLCKVHAHARNERAKPNNPNDLRP